MREWRRRGDMVLRVLAALPLGYAVGSLWTAAFGRVLPLETSEATVAATLLSFPLCAAAAMWAFAARSGWRAFWTLCAVGAPALAIVWASIVATGRA
jgi:hypothetical protein